MDNVIKLRKNLTPGPSPKERGVSPQALHHSLGYDTPLLRRGAGGEVLRHWKNCGSAILCLLCCVLCFTNLFSQQNLTLNREFAVLNENDSSHFSLFKPYIREPIFSAKDKAKKKLFRKLKTESLIIVNDTADKFYLTVDPLFNFEIGKDLQDKTGERLYQNTRGLMIKGSIGKKFAFESFFCENQSTYVQYIDNYIAGTNNVFPQTANYNYSVIPGQGRSKPFKQNGYDYATSSGYISYTPIHLFNIQVGHGKHFVGDGYRSLLLSDNAFNYPYARITTTFKNIQYTNLYTSFMNLTDGGVKTDPSIERLFQKKIGSFQLLSIHLFNRLQVVFFQGMIWKAADSTNRQSINFNTFDPIIGVNTFIYGLHNRNTILVGTTVKLKITNSISLYGQLVLDDVAAGREPKNTSKKYGYQVGFKYADLFTIKKLHLQCEYNIVRPYTYAAANPYQSYTHYNQALAHPLGANFNELVGIINYRIKDFFIEVKANYASIGIDSTTFNYGGSIFNQDIHIGYLVNPSTNFNIVVGISTRLANQEKLTSKTQFVYIGMRTSLANFYYDF